MDEPRFRYRNAHPSSAPCGLRVGDVVIQKGEATPWGPRVKFAQGSKQHRALSRGHLVEEAEEAPKRATKRRAAGKTGGKTGGG